MWQSQSREAEVKRVNVLVGACAVAVAAGALVIGNPAAAGATLGVGAVAVTVEAKAKERRRRAAASGLADQAPHGAEGGWQSLEHELRRDRRHGRNLTLVRLVPCDGRSLGEAARVVTTLLRTTDICFTTADSVFVALPEVGRGEADRAAQRLNEHMTASGTPCAITTATYPDDALTVNGLVARTHPEALSRQSDEVEAE